VFAAATSLIKCQPQSCVCPEWQRYLEVVRPLSRLLASDVWDCARHLHVCSYLWILFVRW